LAVIGHADRIGLFRVALRIELLPFIEAFGNELAAAPATSIGIVGSML
jgi:hypothetical protein